MVALACAFVFAACAPAAETPSESASTEASTAPEASTEASAEASAPAADGDITVELVAKGFQHQFWQVVKEGAEAAGKDLGVSINFQGPPSESDIRPRSIC